MKLTQWGMIGTLFWCCLIFSSIITNQSVFMGLSPNSWGDFLAGAFGPLALFWLVLGFLQQGKELQNSVDALNLQAKELANSVKQQEEMVKVTRETLQHEREVLEQQRQLQKGRIQPVFDIVFQMYVRLGTGVGKHRINVTNTGADVTFFKIEIYVDGKLFLDAKARHFRNGQSCNRDHQQYFDPIEGTIDAVVKYIDAEQDHFEKRYVITLDDDGNRSSYTVWSDPTQRF